MFFGGVEFPKINQINPLVLVNGTVAFCFLSMIYLDVKFFAEAGPACKSSCPVSQRRAWCCEQEAVTSMTTAVLHGPVLPNSTGKI